MTMFVASVYKDGQEQPLPAGGQITDAAGTVLISVAPIAVVKVAAATTANISDLGAGAPNTLDSQSLNTNDLVLVKDQTDAKENGIYSVTSVGTGTDGQWSRASDFNQDTEINGLVSVWVEEGVKNGNTEWNLTGVNLVIGTDLIVFVKVAIKLPDADYQLKITLDGQNALSNTPTMSATMPKAGFITLSSVYGQNARTAGSATFTLAKNGTAFSGTDLNLTLDNTNTQKDFKTTAYGTSGLSFDAGDSISFLCTSTDWTPSVDQFMLMFGVNYNQ